jgi:hypothetical protein
VHCPASITALPAAKATRANRAVVKTPLCQVLIKSLSAAAPLLRSAECIPRHARSCSAHARTNFFGPFSIFGTRYKGLEPSSGPAKAIKQCKCNEKGQLPLWRIESPCWLGNPQDAEQSSTSNTYGAVDPKGDQHRACVNWHAT